MGTRACRCVRCATATTRVRATLQMMMTSRSRLPAPLLALVLLLCGGGGGGGDDTMLNGGVGVRGVGAWEPVPVLSTRDLQANMYPTAGHAPCVLLLNATGSVGCSSTCPRV